MRTEQLSEERIVEAAQNGHLESFAALYQRYHSPMVALAYSLLANRDLAEEAAQEVFAIACRDLDTLKRKDKFGAWLAGICRNVARQALRSKGRTTAHDRRPATEGNEDKEPRWEAVRRAVWKLPDAERDLIVMRYYDGFSHAHISQVLDISPSAVNGRLVRAKRKIAKYLRRNGFTGEDYETA